MIRIAEKKDIEIITEYNLKMAEETEGLKLEEGVVRNGVRQGLMDPARATYYVYEIDEKVVGQLMITKEWSDWRNGEFWWIQSVYVAESYRHQGIFRDLYDYVRKLAESDANVCGMRIYVEKNNKTAQETYKKLGMKETNYLLFEDTDNIR